MIWRISSENFVPSPVYWLAVDVSDLGCRLVIIIMFVFCWDSNSSFVSNHDHTAKCDSSTQIPGLQGTKVSCGVSGRNGAKPYPSNPPLLTLLAPPGTGNDEVSQ